MADSTYTGTPADPFINFWTEFWKKAATLGAATPQPPPDVMSQLRKMFFDAMSEHAERYMRSEAFLSAMKQSMENTLAWQQQMNAFMQKNLAAAQAPSRVDADHTVVLVRGMEDRLMARLEKLDRRIAALEGRRAAKTAATADGRAAKRAARNAAGRK